MKRLCLDTSAYTQFKAGHQQAVRIISQAREIGIPSIVLGELLAGFRFGQRAEQNESELNEFLNNAVVAGLDVDYEAAACYAEIYGVLRRKGKPVPTNDLWIAAIAMRDGLTLLTFDSHFDNIDNIAKCCLAN